MIKAAVVIGVLLGAAYYTMLSSMWDSTLGQAQAYQQQYEQATTMAEQLALGQQPER